MENYTKVDRKQVFGSEELDTVYMTFIRKLCEDRIKRISLAAA